MASNGFRVMRLAALLMGTAIAVPALGQTASQITPPSFAPPEQARAQAPLSLPADMLESPAGAEALFIQASGVEIQGGTLATDTSAQLRDRITNKRVPVAEIFAAARDAEAAEARRGRVLVRVLIPRQNLADGMPVRIVVVEGFVERIDVSSIPERVRSRVSALLDGLVDRNDISLAEIERRLTIAADVPGLTLRSTLAPGERQGGTILRIDATWRPVSAFLSLDNSLSSALGRAVFAAGVDFNSGLGAGELIYLRASGLPNTGSGTSMLDATPRNRALAAGVIVPVGRDGMTLRAEFTDARTAPRHDASLPGFGSRFRRFSVALRYPLIRQRALSIGVEGQFDAENERVSVISPLTLPLSSDRLRTFRAAADLNAWLPGGGVATGRIEASFGVDGLGARSAADATAILPLSRVGADADFRKLEISAHIEQPVAPHLSFDLNARGQTSFADPLLNSQQFGIAALDAISPLPSGALQGDTGYVVRAEARAPFAIAQPDLFASFAPYLFAAQGAVQFEQPTFFERRVTRAFAYGAGIRLSGQPSGLPGLQASVEYGRAHVVGRRPDRLSFTLLIRF